MNTETLQRTAPPTSPAPQQVTDPADNEAGRCASATIRQTAGEQARQVASGLRESGEEALQAAKETGSSLVSQQKEKIAAKLDEYTSAVKAACETLKSDHDNLLAGPAERASRQLERAAGYLRNKEPMDLLDDLGAYARRRPEIVYGGLFAAGLAAVRFLKASSRGRETGRTATAPTSIHGITSSDHLP
jgi:gas vesicle protein